MEMKAVLSDYAPLAKTILAVFALVLVAGFVFWGGLALLARGGVDETANGEALIVYTDPETGCQYLQPQNSRNKEHLIRRYAPDGTQICAPVTTRRGAKAGDAQ